MILECEEKATTSSFYVDAHQAVMGEIQEHPSRLSKELAKELLSLAPKDADHQTLIGKTMCTNDFYEGKL